MTMVHIATKAISRKAGQSAVACAAYRSGDVLYDETYGKTHDYSKKAGVMSADLILPSALAGANIDRAEVWNKAELAENRSDARVAREWLINLPYELDEGARKDLAHEFAQMLADRYNVIADVCIHKPVMKLPHDPTKKPSSKMLRLNEENPDPRNYHAHIMVTTREATLDADGKLFFDPNLKSDFEWSNKKREANGLQSSIKEIKEVRQLWVDTANKALVQNDLDLMDARTYKERGIDRTPTIKMGVDATAMERKGIETEKGAINRAINMRNAFVAENEIIIKSRATNERYIAANTDSITAISRCLDQSKRQLESHQQQAIGVNNLFTDRASQTPFDAPNPFDDALRNGRIARKSAIDSYSRSAKDFNRASDEHTTAVHELAIDANQWVKQREREVNSFYENAQNVIMEIANTAVHHKKYYLNDHPKPYEPQRAQQFDKRQMALINTFAVANGLVPEKAGDRSNYDFIVDASKMFTNDFMTENRAVISLLKNPEQERLQYDQIKQGFNDFIVKLDAQRDIAKHSIHGVNADRYVGKMVSNAATATDYLKAIDDYIDDDMVHEDCKNLAIEHRDREIKQTCQSIKFALIESNKANNGEVDTSIKRQTHVQAVQNAVNDFSRSYSETLTDHDIRAVNDGLNSTNIAQQSSTNRLEF